MHVLKTVGLSITVKHERHSKPVEVEEEKEPEETKAKPNNDQKYLWELRRSVDPHLYRNISLEIWEEGKHALQQKDMAVAASLLQFKSGDQCNVCGTFMLDCFFFWLLDSCQILFVHVI